MQKRMRYKTIVCFLLVSMFLCFSGCSSKTNDTKTIQVNQQKDTNVEYRYSSTELALPEENFIVSQVAADQSNIYIYGFSPMHEGEDHMIYRYSMSGSYEGSFTVPKYSDEYKFNIMNLYVDMTGNIWLLKYASAYNMVGNDREISDSISSWHVDEYSSSGELLLSFAAGDGNAQYTNISANQSYVLLAGENGLASFDYTGNMVSSINDRAIVSTLFAKDGQAYVISKKTDSIEIGLLDIGKGSIVSSLKIPETTNRVLCAPDQNYRFLLEMSGGIYGLDEAAGTLTQIADFVDYSIVHNNKGVIPLSESKILIYNSQHIQIFSPSTNDGSIVTLTLGTLDSQFLSDMVEKFNASNDKYQIKVVDYSQYNLSSSSSEGIMKLNTEIISGNGPDIFDLYSLPVAQYEHAGILVDLYPYINSDEQTKNMEFVEPVIKVMENNGRLYKLIPSYSIMTLIGSDMFFEENALTFSQLSELASNGVNPFFRSMSKQSFLDCILSVNNPVYIDLESNTCNFESEEFIQTLNFIKNLPDEVERGYEKIDIMSGDQILSRQYFTSYSDIAYFNYIFNDTLCFAGIPTHEGTGTVVCPFICLGISQNCQYKDGAWEFLKQYLLDDYQNLIVGSFFPLSQKAFDLTEDDFRKWMEESGKLSITDNLGKDVTLYITGNESFERIDNLVSSVISLYNNDTRLFDLVWDCISPFFRGEKSADEVASITQSKVSLFLSEQYG